jgi:hypothetical protein
MRNFGDIRLTFRFYTFHSPLRESHEMWIALRNVCPKRSQIDSSVLSCVVGGFGSVNLNQLRSL